MVSLLNLTCPVLVRIETANSLDIDIDYMRYRQCSCMSDTYAQFSPLRCLACPSRLTCSQGVLSPLHFVQPGFFPVFTEANIQISIAYLITNIVNATVCPGFALPTKSKHDVLSFTTAASLAMNYFRDCQLTSNISALVIQSQLMLMSTPLRCRSTSDCPGITTLDHTSIFGCAMGRNSNSLLCSQCIPGYYLTSNHNCLVCPSDFQWLAPIVNCVLAVVICVVLWKHTSINGQYNRAISQITMFWLQVNVVALSSKD